MMTEEKDVREDARQLALNLLRENVQKYLESLKSPEASQNKLSSKSLRYFNATNGFNKLLQEWSHRDKSNLLDEIIISTLIRRNISKIVPTDDNGKSLFEGLGDALKDAGYSFDRRNNSICFGITSPEPSFKCCSMM